MSDQEGQSEGNVVSFQEKKDQQVAMEQEVPTLQIELVAGRLVVATNMQVHFALPLLEIAKGELLRMFSEQHLNAEED